MAGDVVEHVAHLPDVDRVEGEMMEVRVAEVDQRHHVVVGVDVEPDPGLAEPVGEAHPENVGVEPDAGLESAVRQLTWPSFLAPPRCTVVEGRACCGRRSASLAGTR